MNELKLDYTRKGKQSSKIKRILMIAGILMIVLSLATLLLVITQGFTGALLIPAIANLGLGIHFILQSVEHKILFPKKYFHISDKVIAFKLGGFYKEKCIQWDAITRISDKGKSVHLYSGEQVTKINMLHFPSADEMRIKASIKAFAEAKHL